MSPLSTAFLSPAQVGGPWLVAILVAGAVLLLVYGIALIAARSGRRLQTVFEHYDLDRTDGAKVSGRSGRSELLSLASLRRAAEVVNDTLEQRGLKDQIGLRLEAAGLTVNPAEYVLVSLLAAVVGAFGGFALHGILGGMAGIALVGLGAFGLVRVKARSRRSRFEAQIGDMLKLLGSSLRAGLSLSQGLDAVSDQMREPARSELKRVTSMARLGQPLPVALTETAERMSSREMSALATAVDVQSEVGGNLAEILDIAAESIRERAGLRREVKSLTAEGRMSAYVLGAIPLVIVFILAVTDPSYMRPLFLSTDGRFALLGAASLEILGALWMRRIVDIEV